MRGPRTLLFRLLDPFGAALARQLGGPRGWFGCAVMTRFLNRGNRALMEATLDGVRLRGDTRLLDVGFGGGLLLELAWRRGVRRLAGVDPSEAAVAFLRGRAARFAQAELRVERGAVQALPFDDASFDVVASTNTVYFWPELGPAFAEMRRVLAAGGVLALGFSSAQKLRQFQGITRHGFHFHPTEELAAAAEAAGLADVQVQELHGGTVEGDCVLRAACPGSNPSTST